MLLPCPFCGSSDIDGPNISTHHQETLGGPDIALEGFVSCNECGATTVEYVDSPDETRALADTVAAWNRRTETAADRSTCCRVLGSFRIKLSWTSQELLNIPLDTVIRLALLDPDIEILGGPIPPSYIPQAVRLYQGVTNGTAPIPDQIRDVKMLFNAMRFEDE